MARNFIRYVISCRCCDATGMVALPDIHIRVLEQIKKSYRPLSAPEIARLLREPVGITAINNRLEDLRKWGYVVRSRHGKTWMYSAK